APSRWKRLIQPGQEKEYIYALGGPEMARNTTKPAMKRRAPEKELSPFTREVVECIRRIPRGKVTAYGGIAAMAGNPRAARQVARLLYALSDSEKLPWHRVVNRQGRISLPMDGAGGEQRRLLLRESVAVDAAGTMDLEKFGWRPGETGGPPLRVRRPKS